MGSSRSNNLRRRASAQGSPGPRVLEIQAKLRELSTPESSALAARFFKTGPGEYGEGDRFLGIRAADLRNLARAYHPCDWADLETLIQSPVHEDRALALLLLVKRVEKGPLDDHSRAFKLYLAHTAFVNNWDLVDLSAKEVVGAYLARTTPAGERSLLDDLARSTSLWERRIAIVATFWFIRGKEYDDALRIAGILLQDPHDLIHKAVGWMLREIGKRDQDVLESFLRRHIDELPRTTLRYAIERFPPSLRRAYLTGDLAAMSALGDRLLERPSPSTQ